MHFAFLEILKKSFKLSFVRKNEFFTLEPAHDTDALGVLRIADEDKKVFVRRVFVPYFVYSRNEGAGAVLKGKKRVLTGKRDQLLLGAFFDAVGANEKSYRTFFVSRRGKRVYLLGAHDLDPLLLQLGDVRLVVDKVSERNYPLARLG